MALGSLGLLGLALPGAAWAQTGVISTVAGVTLNASQNQKITVTVTWGGVQNIPALTDGAINAFPTPVRITTTWSLDILTIGNHALVGYFTNPTQALTNGTNGIPASLVEGRMVTGLPTTFTPFTQAGHPGAGTAGGSLDLWRVFTFIIFNLTGTRTDDLELRLNLTGQPALAAGTYAGTLFLRAVVY
jgi:hypothetical protein